MRQLDAIAARVVANLAAARAAASATPAQIAYLDVDDTVRATYGYAKQGVGYGYSGVKGPQRAARGVVDSNLGPVVGGEEPVVGCDEPVPEVPIATTTSSLSARTPDVT